MRIATDPRVYGHLLAACLLLSIVANAAPPPGKGGGNGGGDTSDPPPQPPVSYALEIVPVEGLIGGNGAQRGSSLNDKGQFLCRLSTSEISATVDTDSDSTPAIVDVNTGEIIYIDNLLTAETIWSSLPEDADACDLLVRGINNDSDVVAIGFSIIGSHPVNPIGYLLKCLRDEQGTITGYDPIVIGPAYDLWLNDVGEIVVEDRLGSTVASYDYYLRRVDGTEIHFRQDFPYSTHIDIHGFNNQGQILASQRLDDVQAFEGYVWSQDGSILPYTPFIGYSKCDINDYSVVAGGGRVLYEVKERGKIVTKGYWAPAVLDPVTGPTILHDHQESFANNYVPIRINDQRLNNESTVLANVYVDPERTLWLKLPGAEGFHLYDALDTADKALWESLNYRDSFYWDNADLATPLRPDGSIAHEEAPIVIGYAEPVQFNAIGLFVFRPVP